MKIFLNKDVRFWECSFMNLSISNLPKPRISDLRTSGPIAISCTQYIETTTSQHDQSSQDSKTLPQVWESVQRNKPQHS